MVCISYEKWAQIALSDRVLPREDALKMLQRPEIDILALAAAAGKVRMATFGKKVKVHQINNVQNGLCPEDCGYCGQSKISGAPIKKYPMKSADEIVREAHAAKASGVYRYCMVASGRGPTDKRAEELADIIARINNEVGIKTCLSVGLVSFPQAQRFKAAGLDRLNHNLNTSERYTPQIVTTHTYQDRINTLHAAKQAGLDTCSGMIVGMGESDADIIEVAYTLREMEAPSIPINFLVPVPGNPIYDFNQLTPQRCLRILCLFRFVNPKAEIRMAGGREGHLRGLQSVALYPANSLFVDGYLVTRGDAKNKTYQMIEDAGFEIESDAVSNKPSGSAGKFAIDEDPNIMHPKTSR